MASNAPHKEKGKGTVTFDKEAGCRTKGFGGATWIMQHCVVAAAGGGRREAEERQSVMRAQYFVLFAAGFVLLCGSKFRGSVVIMLVALVTKVGPIGGGFTFAIPSRTTATAVVMRNLTASVWKPASDIGQMPQGPTTRLTSGNDETCRTAGNTNRATSDAHLNAEFNLAMRKVMTRKDWYK